MKVVLLFGPLLCLCLLPAVAAGKTVVLEAGESYQQGDLTVVCTDREADEPLVLTECQYWDDFNRTCLYERRIHRLGELVCVEECQHWDDFRNRCDYATSCVFHADQRIFVQTRCEEFDDFAHRCVKTRQEMITDR